MTAGWQGSARAVLPRLAAAGLAFVLVSADTCAAAPDDSGAAAALSGFTMRWMADSPEAGRAVAEVSGLDAATLKQLREAKWNREHWQQLFAVHAEHGDLLADVGIPPMLGAYRLTANSLRFEPQFPLEPGLQYRATFWPGRLPGRRSATKKPLTAVFRPSTRSLDPSTVVTQVYPSGATLPENLLKFYVHFSAPMSRGHIYDHIHLQDEAGKYVELPFLEIDEELWNAEMTRLTLFIDPGRIKRGVKPLEDIGPAMEEGKRYTLIIDQAWRDGAGRPLKMSFQKAFHVGPPDRDPPDPATWKIIAPKSETRDALAVTFPDSMDHALALRLIRPAHQSGRLVEGEAALEDHERRWRFVPKNAWPRGAFQLLVQTAIEDLAGNNIGKPFEVDVFEGIQRRLTNSTVALPFEIR